MEINNISFAYRDKIKRLHNINLTINHGEITTIIGPNGSGKSTLLGVMTDNYKPQEGHVILDGKLINQYKPKELAVKLGVVHQQNSAPADMTVENLVAYGRLPHRSTFSLKSERDTEMIEWALKRTSLNQHRHVPIEALSGGQQQRVWIAMVLAQDTPLLFLDEPTANLDIYFQYDILQLIKDLREEHELTVVMVLHDINQAIQYSDTVIAMKDGEVIKTGKPKNIMTEQLIQNVYGVNVAVKQDSDVGTYVVPLGV